MRRPPAAGGALVGVRGAGDLATGVIHRLHRAGFAVVATELPQPTVLRRSVAFASAVWEATMTVEGVTAVRVDPADVARALARQEVALLVDPDGRRLRALRAAVLVDATMAKRPGGVGRDDAPLVIALGPGWTAGRDVDAVVETNRGHHLGRVILEGTAEPDTGVPGPIDGHAAERVLRAPRAGRFRGCREIADVVEAGTVVATVDGAPVVAGIAGVLRGLLHDGCEVRSGMKVGDVDPRAVPAHCLTISDKARAVAGGVLEAILWLRRQPAREPQPVDGGAAGC